MADFFIFILILFCIALGYIWGLCDQRKKNTTSYENIANRQKNSFSDLELEFTKKSKTLDIMQELQIKNNKLDSCLLLANVFRDKGEFDKSIQLYYKLLADSQLKSCEIWLVQIELAKSFYCYGLLDRAENLLITIIHQKPKQKTILIQAIKQLLQIYEHEKEWIKAINIAKKLECSYKSYVKKIISQFYCELGEDYLSKMQKNLAYDVATKAIKTNKNSVRASLLLAKIEFNYKNYNSAIQAAQRVKNQDIRFLSLTIPLLEKSCRYIDSYEQLHNFYQDCIKIQPNSAVVLALSSIILNKKGKNQALEFLVSQLKDHPTLKSLYAFINLKLTDQNPLPELISIFKIVQRILEIKPVFRCLHCGFSSKKMYWKCPSCNQWEKIIPIQGIEGE